MKRKVKILTWFYLLTKRLFKYPAFWLLLFIIPVIIPAFNTVAEEDAGAVNVAIYSKQSEITDKIISSVMDSESVVIYQRVGSLDEAMSLVKSGKCHTAWIFDDDFENKLISYVKGESDKPFVTVVEQEENMFLILTREKLHGAIYPHITYEVYKDFVQKEITKGEYISEEKLKTFYDKEKEGKEVVEIKTISSDGNIDIKSYNYLKTPLRGLMSMIVMLCGFAAAGLYMKDRQAGLYDWLGVGKRIVPAVGLCLSAILISAVVLIISVFVGGLATQLYREVLSLMVYIISTTVFCVFVCTVFDKFEYFGPTIPFMMLSMIIMCPVFFNVESLAWIKYLMPPYYYLMSVEFDGYYICSAVYSLIMIFIVWIVNKRKAFVRQ